MENNEEYFWLKFEQQNLSKSLKVISKSKAKCDLNYQWTWHGSRGPKGAGWYRKFTFEEYNKITEKNNGK